jgi:hypothetical protein
MMTRVLKAQGALRMRIQAARLRAERGRRRASWRIYGYRASWKKLYSAGLTGFKEKDENGFERPH